MDDSDQAYVVDDVRCLAEETTWYISTPDGCSFEFEGRDTSQAFPHDPCSSLAPEWYYTILNEHFNHNRTFEGRTTLLLLTQYRQPHNRLHDGRVTPVPELVGEIPNSFSYIKPRYKSGRSHRVLRSLNSMSARSIPIAGQTVQHRSLWPRCPESSCPPPPPPIFAPLWSPLYIPPCPCRPVPSPRGVRIPRFVLAATRVPFADSPSGR